MDRWLGPATKRAAGKTVPDIGQQDIHCERSGNGVAGDAQKTEPGGRGQPGLEEPRLRRQGSPGTNLINDLGVARNGLSTGPPRVEATTYARLRCVAGSESGIEQTGLSRKC